jgi:uncharacterized Zn finger protein
MRDLGLLSETLPPRAHRIRSLDVLEGVVRVSIHDRNAGGCTIEVLVKPITDDQWRRIVSAIASQSILAAQVAAGAAPPEIEHVFSEAGASLLPVSAAEFTATCSCCTAGECRHLSTVYALIGEMLVDDPWILFLLRGRGRQQILIEVREAREGPHNPVSAHGLLREASGAPYGEIEASGGSAQIEADTGGDAIDLERFWGDRQLMKHFQHHIAPPNIELTLLRRLGPMTSADTSMTVYEHLVSLYRSVTEEALALAYAPDEDA